MFLQRFICIHFNLINDDIQLRFSFDFLNWIIILESNKIPFLKIFFTQVLMSFVHFYDIFNNNHDKTVILYLISTIQLWNKYYQFCVSLVLGFFLPIRVSPSLLVELFFTIKAYIFCVPISLMSTMGTLLSSKSISLTSQSFILVEAFNILLSAKIEIK